jgi:hypothetical protein
MAYYTFLKSLRSLEEFRKKILTSKLLPNLLERISKALVNSKIQFLIRKSFFLFISHFRPSYPYRPTRPLAQPARWPPPPHWASASRPAQPALLAQPGNRLVGLFGPRGHSGLLPPPAEPTPPCLHRHGRPSAQRQPLPLLLYSLVVTPLPLQAAP